MPDSSLSTKFQDLRSRVAKIESGEDWINETFEGQLFSNTPWYLASQISKPEVQEQSLKKEEVQKPVLNEKTKALDSLRQYAEEKTEGKTEKVVKFLGGELEVTGSSKPGLIVHDFSSNASEINENENIEVIFLGDPCHEGEEDLLGKMIGAMGLESQKVLRLPLPEFEDEPGRDNFLEEFCQKLYSIKPRVLMSLGAAATNLLLKKRERLSIIHGRFFETQLNFSNGSFQFPMVPIFHPDFLVINPKMKRTAWIDLQQVMEFLKEN